MAASTASRAAATTSAVAAGGYAATAAATATRPFRRRPRPFRRWPPRGLCLGPRPAARPRSSSSSRAAARARRADSCVSSPPTTPYRAGPPRSRSTVSTSVSDRSLAPFPTPRSAPWRPRRAGGLEGRPSTRWSAPGGPAKPTPQCPPRSNFCSCSSSACRFPFVAHLPQRGVVLQRRCPRRPARSRRPPFSALRRDPPRSDTKRRGLASSTRPPPSSAPLLGRCRAAPRPRRAPRRARRPCPARSSRLLDIRQEGLARLLRRAHRRRRRRPLFLAGAPTTRRRASRSSESRRRSASSIEIFSSRYCASSAPISRRCSSSSAAATSAANARARRRRHGYFRGDILVVALRAATNQVRRSASASDAAWRTRPRRAPAPPPRRRAWPRGHHAPSPPPRRGLRGRLLGLARGAGGFGGLLASFLRWTTLSISSTPPRPARASVWGRLGSFVRTAPTRPAWRRPSAALLLREAAVGRARALSHPRAAHSFASNDTRASASRKSSAARRDVTPETFPSSASCTASSSAASPHALARAYSSGSDARDDSSSSVKQTRHDARAHEARQRDAGASHSVVRSFFESFVFESFVAKRSASRVAARSRRATRRERRRIRGGVGASPGLSAAMASPRTRSSQRRRVERVLVPGDERGAQPQSALGGDPGNIRRNLRARKRPETSPQPRRRARRRQPRWPDHLR